MKQEFHSRYDDPTPIQCEDCGWRGKVMDCIHTYYEIPGTEGDVEPADECPDCGSDNLFTRE